MLFVNSNWRQQYNSVKKQFTWKQRLWHLVWAPVMMDPETKRCYSKYMKKGLYIKLSDPEKVPYVGPKGRPYLPPDNLEIDE